MSKVEEDAINSLASIPDDDDYTFLPFKSSLLMQQHTHRTQKIRPKTIEHKSNRTLTCIRPTSKR